LKVYIDSSILVKLYVPEPESEDLERFIIENTIIIPFTPLHELEIGNAIALKEFRKEISHEEKVGIMQAIQADKDSRVLHRHPLTWNRVFEKSREFSSNYTCDLGTRALDVLHVASAVCGEFRYFLSHDDRQMRLAEKAGLEVAEL